MRGWIALGGLIVGLLFGFIARGVDGGNNALFFIAGLGFLAAFGAGVSMLPLWRRIGLRLPTMAGLFTALSGLYFVSDLERRADNVSRDLEQRLVEDQ